MKLKIKKGDTVQVIAGNDKGSTGRVLAVYASKMRILVEGVNIVKKHSKPSQKNQKGGIISMEMPVNYSNVQIVDSDKNPSRIAIRFDEKNEGASVRYAVSNGKDL